ncbi:MAG: PfkB family carbohydrate kinase [Coriobacteriia bacterium]|nr:PfkB family carbohydrate kinase [Coriobacteriia bacterium]
MAGFLSALAHELKMEQAVLHGNALAAISVEHKGATFKVTPKKLQKKLTSN